VACYAATSSSEVQFWSLQSTGTANRFRIRSGNTGKCLGVADNTNGGHIQQQSCDSTNLFQQWDFVNRGRLDRTTGAGDKAPGYSFYQIRNAGGATKRCIAPFNASSSQGQLFHQYTCNTPASNPAGNEQVWAFTR
jgi:hypothetical protein